MSDSGWNDIMPWVASGGAGVLGRLMFVSKLVNEGKRKPFTWAMLLDVPVALGTGWIALGLSTWLNLPYEARISLAIFFGYLGPYGLDTIFGILVKRFEKKG